jgi:hypothetical protein
MQPKTHERSLAGAGWQACQPRPCANVFAIHRSGHGATPREPRSVPAYAIDGTRDNSLKGEIGS